MKKHIANVVTSIRILGSVCMLCSCVFSPLSDILFSRSQHIFEEDAITPREIMIKGPVFIILQLFLYLPSGAVFLHYTAAYKSESPVQLLYGFLRFLLRFDLRRHTNPEM